MSPSGFKTEMWAESESRTVVLKSPFSISIVNSLTAAPIVLTLKDAAWGFKDNAVLMQS
jgi:hypothetical protein